MPLFKALHYIRRQEGFNLETQIGDDEPFIPDDQWIDLNAIKKDISNTKLLLEY